tara:strand:+ start:74 stop:325 length:252 start_codon:yes stop_codon:yes gene_type:complete
MRLNENFNQNENESELELNAESAMELIMGSLYEMVLEPAHKSGQLTEEDQELLGSIGLTLKTIAEKARAYEKLQEGENPFGSN